MHSTFDSLKIARKRTGLAGLVVREISLGPRPSPIRDLLRAFNCAGRWRETLKRGRPGMKHHVPIDAPGRARPVASTANMYTLASVRLLSFWLTATCSSAVKAYTYAYHTCVKRSRVYIVVVEATGRARPGVYPTSMGT